MIEVIYDPFLTWRNFLHGHFADHRYIQATIVQLHVELVPFIYGSYLCFVVFLLLKIHTFQYLSLFIFSILDCFQFETIIHLPEIGVPLVHMLGAIISGSQVLILLFYQSYVFFLFILLLLLLLLFVFVWLHTSRTLVYLRFDSVILCLP